MNLCKTFFSCFALFSLAAITPARAAAVDVDGGQTNVVLNTDALAAAAGLTLDSVGPGTIVPGALTPGAGETSAAFPIDASTMFSYTPGDFLNTFSQNGSIEHNGTIGFNITSDADPTNDATVGDFSIRFDAIRAVGTNSGFFVQSTTGVVAPLFDVLLTGSPLDETTSLTIEGDLAVSDEFGLFLANNGFSSSNLAGTVVGRAQVAATAVPEPASLALLAGVAGVLITSRRR